MITEWEKCKQACWNELVQKRQAEVKAQRIHDEDDSDANFKAWQEACHRLHWAELAWRDVCSI